MGYFAELAGQTCEKCGGKQKLCQSLSGNVPGNYFRAICPMDPELLEFLDEYACDEEGVLFDL